MAFSTEKKRFELNLTVYCGLLLVIIFRTTVFVPRAFFHVNVEVKKTLFNVRKKILEKLLV